MKTVSIHQLFQKSSKRMRFLGIASVLLISVLGFSYYYNVVNPNSARAFSGAGLGTTDDPFQISNCSELQSIGNSPNGYNYVLMNDIDCSDTINWNGGSGFKPIEGYFSGEINGRNYEIKDLYINRPTTYAVGLFSFVGPGAQLTNIRLTKSETNKDRVDINGARSVGALTAEFGGYKISNVHSELNVQSNGRASDAGGTDSGMSIGGLVGINYSNIATSSSSGNVTVADNDLPDRWVSAGGLVGHVRSQLPDTSNASVKNSFATGNINLGSPNKTINGRCGGLVGEITVLESASTGTEVSKSYSTGSITCDKTDSTDLSIGGLIGAIIVGENATVAPTVMNNFTTSNITTTDGYGFYGIYWNGTEQNGNTGIANTDLSNNANVFDVTRTGKSTCGSDSRIGCEAVNSNNSQPDYFTSINNNTGFYNTWDQTSTWTITTPYPVLKPIVMRPDPVLNLNVVRNGDNFEASWEDPVDNEGRFTNIRFYQLYYKDKGNNGAWQQYEPDTLILEKSKTISGLAIPGNYSFKVRAISDAPGFDVIGLFSAALDFATGMPATAPQNVAVQPNAKSANVSWDTVENATSYQIQYKPTSSIEWKNGGVYSDTNAKIGVLTPGTSYQIRVTASNVAGIGPWSETTDFSTNVQTTYYVSNCQQLQDVNNNLEGIYIQNANIDCSDVPNFAVIGGAQNVFLGNYDGKGYTISNVTISTDVEANSTNWAGVGVFGLVAGGNLANITIKDSTIVGNYKLSESVDSDGNGLPDAPAAPNVPAVQPIGDLPV